MPSGTHSGGPCQLQRDLIKRSERLTYPDVRCLRADLLLWVPELQTPQRIADEMFLAGVVHCDLDGNSRLHPERMGLFAIRFPDPHVLVSPGGNDLTIFPKADRQYAVG